MVTPTTYNNPVNYQDPDGLSVRVCGTDGGCTDEKTDLSDEEWNKRFYRDPSIKLKDGNIYKNGEFIGTFQNLGIDGAPFSSALIDAGRRPYGKAVLAFAGVSVAGGLLASVVIPASSITTLGLGTTTATAAPSVVGQAFSQATLRAFQRQLAEHGRRSLETSLKTFGKRLTEHLLKIEAARRAGGYTSSMETEVKIFRESIAAIKQILGNGP